MREARKIREKQREREREGKVYGKRLLKKIKSVDLLVSRSTWLSSLLWHPIKLSRHKN